jgi:outer membrane protein assembly factor BamE (lipoprotein component of BamABCDE complex)
LPGAAARFTASILETGAAEVKHMKGHFVRTSALAIALAAGVGACAPVRTTHGFISDNRAATEVQVGVDTKSSVLQRLGSPSTTAVFDQTSWYYISSTQQRFAFYNPTTVEREVLVVRFGADDVVTAVDRYGVERGQVVAYSEDATPTRGRELGLLEQIFGSVGRAPPIRTEEEGPRRDR